MKTAYINGLFTTMDHERPSASACVCEDGRFVFVGRTEDALKLSCDEVIDLKGAAVYPGFIDTHLHILNKAVTSRGLELDSAASRESLFEMVKSAAQAENAPDFINGRGFNEDLWSDKRLPTRSELDEVSPNVPVMLTRVCGHVVVVNSKAIEVSGITSETPQPDGGRFDLNTGLFAENAIGLIESDSGARDVKTCKELLYAGMKHARENGLTAIYSDDMGTYGFSMQTVYSAYRELENEGRMPVRVVQQCALPDRESFDEFTDYGLYYMKGTDMYRIGPRKLYIDGSLGARTALISVPYADAPEKAGIPIYTQAELNELAKQSHRHGMPIIVHAIGDAGCKMVLDAIEYARNAVPDTDDLPDGIVHCQITRSQELERIGDMGVNVYAQPVFTEYDLHICRDRVGAELEATSYNWRSLYDAGVCITSGSDCPVEPLSPAKNIYCAVTRKDFNHFPEGGWMPEQRLSVSQAVSCHTVLAAKCAGLSDRLGMIKEGFLADMSVYEHAFTDENADAILDMVPLMTVVGGCRAIP